MLILDFSAVLSGNEMIDSLNFRRKYFEFSLAVGLFLLTRMHVLLFNIVKLTMAAFQPLIKSEQ